MVEQIPISQTSSEGEIPVGYVGSDAWKFQIETADVLEDLEHRLRGEFKVVKTTTNQSSGMQEEEIRWEKRGTKLLNDEGIRLIVTMVGGRLSKVQILTNIPEDQVHEMVRTFMIQLSAHLALHYKKYECDEFPLDTTSLSLIVSLAVDYVYPNLARGMDGVFLEYLKPTIRKIESYRPMEEKKKHLGGLLPF